MKSELKEMLEDVKSVVIGFENVEIATISPDDIRDIIFYANDEDTLSSGTFSDVTIILKKSANIIYGGHYEGERLFDRLRAFSDIVDISFEFYGGSYKVMDLKWFGDDDCSNYGQFAELTKAGELHIYFHDIGEIELDDRDYVKGSRCLKSLWLHKMHEGHGDWSLQRDSQKKYMTKEGAIDETENEDRRHTLKRYANDMMPYLSYFDRDIQAVTVAWNGNLPLMIKTAKRWNNEYNDFACVTAKPKFVYKGLYCELDILIADTDWMEIVETAEYPKIYDRDLQNLAYKYFVLTALGYNVRKVSVLHKKHDYTSVEGKVTDYSGELISLDNIEKNLAAYLLSQEKYMLEDCTEKITAMQGSVKANIEVFLGTLKETCEPKVEMGNQCHEPWECAYCEYCSGGGGRINASSANPVEEFQAKFNEKNMGAAENGKN